MVGEGRTITAIMPFYFFSTISPIHSRCESIFGPKKKVTAQENGALMGLSPIFLGYKEEVTAHWSDHKTERLCCTHGGIFLILQSTEVKTTQIGCF